MRVVVVGGGVGGVASAARLAKLGHDVTVVESLPTLGGALGYVEQDGYRWSVGPSTTALPAVVRDLFRKSGRPLSNGTDLVQVEPIREHRFADNTSLALPAGSRAEQTDAVGAALGKDSGARWVEWVHGFADTWDLLRRDYLEHAYSPGHTAKETETLLRDRTTLHRAVSRAFKDERLRTLALYHAVEGGHDPRNVPAWFGLVDYVEQSFGMWTLPGGVGGLTDLLTERLRERRVTVLCDTTVLDLVVSSGRVAAVRTDTDDIPADAVVVAIDPRRLPALAKHVGRTMPAIPPATTYLGLTGVVPALPRELVIHDDATLTIRTDGHAPDGGSAWTVTGRGRLAEDLVIALARKRIDIRDNIEVRVDRSPRELVEHYSGSSYGVLWQGRATVRDKLATTTPVPGVYAAGAHVGLSGELPFVGLTAALVAQAIGPADR